MCAAIAGWLSGAWPANPYTLAVAGIVVIGGPLPASGTRDGRRALRGSRRRGGHAAGVRPRAGSSTDAEARARAFHDWRDADTRSSARARRASCRADQYIARLVASYRGGRACRGLHRSTARDHAPGGDRVRLLADRRAAGVRGLGPEPAVGLLLVLGLEVNLLTLGTEGRRPRPLRSSTVRMLAFALPGALGRRRAAGAAGGGAADVRHARRRGDVAARRVTTAHVPAWVAGLAAGALTTSTSTNGPPMLLHLLGRGARPEQVRDTLTVCFIGLAGIGAVALFVTGDARAAGRHLRRRPRPRRRAPATSSGAAVLPTRGQRSLRAGA